MGSTAAAAAGAGGGVVATGDTPVGYGLTAGLIRVKAGLLRRRGFGAGTAGKATGAVRGGFSSRPHSVSWGWEGPTGFRGCRWHPTAAARGARARRDRDGAGR